MMAPFHPGDRFIPVEGVYAMAKRASKNRLTSTAKRAGRKTPNPKNTSPLKAKKKGVVRKATRTAAETKPTGSAAERHHFLRRLGHEHTVTLKVMRAFPSHQASFQPHPRSQTAKKLMWTFVQEQALTIAAIDGTLGMTANMGSEPDAVIEVIEAYEAGVRNAMARLREIPESGLDRTIKFFVGPGQMGDIPLMEFLWMMLMDSIHHRGQLSVYLRMAGGLVPSIYGPSADEPWH